MHIISNFLSSIRINIYKIEPFILFFILKFNKIFPGTLFVKKHSVIKAQLNENKIIDRSKSSFYEIHIDKTEFTHRK